MNTEEILLDRLKQLKSFVHKNKEIIERLEDYPLDTLIKALESARDVEVGYYKDSQDNYFYIKGIKFNDEIDCDNILYVEFFIVTGDSISRYSIPMEDFKKSFTQKEFLKSTKTEFERTITKVTSKVKKKGFDYINPQKCLNIFNTFYEQINE